MSKLNQNQVFTGAGLFGAAAVLGMLSFGGSAEAAGNLMSCRASNSMKVVACCEQMTRNNRPSWMIESGASCHEVVVCRGQSERRCYIKMLTNEQKGGKESDPKGGRGGGQTAS